MFYVDEGGDLGKGAHLSDGGEKAQEKLSGQVHKANIRLLQSHIADADEDLLSGLHYAISILCRTKVSSNQQRSRPVA